MTSPFAQTARNLAQGIRSGQLSMREVADHFADLTEEKAPALNSHLFFDRADVAAQVEAQERRLKAGEALPLAGVPVLVKDNLCTKGIPTTAGSKILAGFRPPYDAHVVERLRAAGALIFGKANCDEFSMGSSSENSAYGPVRHPKDPTRVPGGSSGGSAAAVAAGLVPAALGSDTGGSIRQPAAFCGLVGLKPTYGRVSRYGLIAYGSSLDQVGPLTTTVEDAALFLDVLSGHDPRDATSRALPATTALAGLTGDVTLKDVRVGVVKELFGEGLESGTRTAVERAVKDLEKLGATVVEVSVPSLAYAIAAYYLIATAEASANLARYDGIRYGHRHQESGQSLKDLYRRSRSEGFGREVKQRIMLGTFALSSGYYDAYYAKANRARAVLSREFDAAFTKADLLVSPTAPTVAYRLGEKTQDPLAMYLGDICTIGANLAGLPALSLPCGDADGLPVGLQLMAPALAEDRLLKGAYAYEQSRR